MFEDESEIVAFLEAAGLRGFLRGDLCAQPLLRGRKSKTATVKAGASRLGGSPDLPAAITWPMRAPYPNGTVDFVMRAEDLKKRNFDRVHAVYQQTYAWGGRLQPFPLCPRGVRGHKR